jgi:hypothetical protein
MLKEVLSLVNAAQRAGRTVGVAIHTLVRSSSPGLFADVGVQIGARGVAAAQCRGF